MKEKNSLVRMADGRNMLVPFVLITTLFFLWGFAHSILDVLNKHFQDELGISKAHSALVQAVVYGGYFLMALPAGEIIRRFGYRVGVLTGLLLYGCGALLFLPGSTMHSFEFFLFSLFIIGCGLTCLETAANPYVTVLGHPSSAERRINLAQSFNGLGWICGPLVGGFFLFASGEGADIAMPYAIIGGVVLLVAAVFSRVRLPEVQASTDEAGQETSASGAEGPGLWQHPHFVWGLCALFLYVAAQTGVNSFFINYVTDCVDVSPYEASQWLSFVGMGLFMAGRMGGSVAMRYLSGRRLLAYCALGALLAMSLVVFCPGWLGTSGYFACFLCESIMFPTIFALSIRGLGIHTKRASSFLIMSIVGGALAPVLMGLIADASAMPVAFVVPMVCFASILAYALWLGRRDQPSIPAVDL